MDATLQSALGRIPPPYWVRDEDATSWGVIAVTLFLLALAGLVVWWSKR